MTPLTLLLLVLAAGTPQASLCWRWANGTPRTWTAPGVCLPVPAPMRVRADAPLSTRADSLMLWAVIRHGPITTTEPNGRRFFHTTPGVGMWVEVHATPLQMAAPAVGGIKITATSPSAIPAQQRSAVSKVKAP